jgi:hypothetical protein
MVLVLAVLTGDSIAQLLQALSPDAEILCDRLLGRVVGEEDEGLESCIGIALLVDAPQDVAEERLEVDGYGALSRLVGASDVVAVASSAVGRRRD